MTGSRVRRALVAAAAFVAAGALAAGLGGCSFVADLLPGGHSAAPTPAAPTPAPAGLRLDCPALLSGDELSALLGSQAAPATPFGIPTPVAATGPAALTAAGGGACWWSAGSGRLSVKVVPHAAAAWAALAQTYPNAATPGADYEGGVSLGGDCHFSPAVWCRTNVLAGDAWIAVELSAQKVPGLNEAGFHAAVQRMLPTLTAAVAHATPAHAAPVVDCASADLRTQLQTVFGVAEAGPLDRNGTFGISEAALASGAARFCPFQRLDGSRAGDYLGSLSVMRGAGAAYEQFRTVVIAADTEAHSASITVGGRDVPALVWTYVSDDSIAAVADAQIGDVWVEFSSWDEDDAQGHVLAMVEWVAGRL